MAEIIDSGLTAGSRPNKKLKKVVLSKGDARYWLEDGRLFKNHDAADYSCRFTTLGRREHFKLGTANKKTAAAKAAEIYTHIQSRGWESALRKFKPKAEKPEETTRGPSVGDLIQAASRLTTARSQTLGAYVKAFRKIVAEVKSVENKGKYDARKGGSKEWQAAVDSIELSSINPTEVNLWRINRIRAAGEDSLRRRNATVTTNSLLRNAKSLFGKKLLPLIEVTLPLPRPLPLEGLDLEKPPSMRYISKIDPFALLAKGREAFQGTDPEALKVLILALVCGLRRSEIDYLLWRAFDFVNSLLRVENSEYHQLKSEDSAGEVDLDAETCAIFKGLRTQAPTALFVIESARKAKNGGRSRSYRCEPIFERVLAWLRKEGVTDPKPLHTLRKEIGSIIASEHGIHAASRYLRHSDIRITAAIYTDKKKTVTPSILKGVFGRLAAEQPAQDQSSRNITP